MSTTLSKFADEIVLAMGWAMNAAQDRFQGQLKVYSEKIYKWIIRIIQGNSEKLYLCYTQNQFILPWKLCSFSQNQLWIAELPWICDPNNFIINSINQVWQWKLYTDIQEIYLCIIDSLWKYLYNHKISMGDDNSKNHHALLLRDIVAWWNPEVEHYKWN
jgi:hypothetical protein